MSRRKNRQHKDLKGLDYHGTCARSGKRQYSSRSHARKARQSSSHTHGNPYRCHWCGYWHLGRYHKQATRAAYRGEPDTIRITTLAAQLDLDPTVVRAAFERLGVTITAGRVPADALPQLQAPNYRKS